MVSGAIPALRMPIKRLLSSPVMLLESLKPQLPDYPTLWVETTGSLNLLTPDRSCGEPGSVRAMEAKLPWQVGIVLGSPTGI